jgi:hypothetical protein
MSSVQLYETTKQRADRKHGDFSFILVLACMALALVVVSAIFAPVPIGSEISNQMLLVGP